MLYQAVAIQIQLSRSLKVEFLGSNVFLGRGSSIRNWTVSKWLINLCDWTTVYQQTVCLFFAAVMTAAPFGKIYRFWT